MGWIIRYLTGLNLSDTILCRIRKENVAYDAQFGSAGQDANWSHDVIPLVKWTNEGSKEVSYSIDLNLEGLKQL